jgi:transcriptional regulator with XRE-family HTH domain
MNTIGENIRRFRRERDITQEMLADRLHISAQAVSKWERGESLPDVTLIVPMASYLGVSADDLLGVNEAILRERLDEFEKFRLESEHKLAKTVGSPAAFEEHQREIGEAVK